MSKKDSKKDYEFEFAGELSAANIFGLEYKEIFSPSVPLDGMEDRMDDRIKKVRNIKKNNIFTGQFHAYKQSQD